MTTKIETFKTQSDFEALGKRIRTAANVPFSLVQTGLIAAFEHIEKNGNVNALKPIVTAIEDTFHNRGMVRRVQAYIVGFTWLEYNARGLKAAALRDAQFDVIWTKNKSKKMDIAGAKATKWHELELPGRGDMKPVDGSQYVKTMFKRLQTMLTEGKLTHGEAKMTIGQLRTELRAALELLEGPKATVVTMKPTKRKAAKKAANVNKPEAPAEAKAA